MRLTRLLVIAGTAIAATYLSHAYNIPNIAANDRVSTAGVFAQIGATMLGFTLAALAVVASISGTELVKTMRKTGHYGDMLREMFTTATLFLACTTLSCVVMLSAPCAWLVPAAAGAHAAALISLIKVGWMLWLVLSNLDEST